MNLQNIETVVLALIGYDAYADLSVDSETLKAADFALLHKCVNIARNEIKLGTFIPQLLKHATSITSSITAARNTITDTDFDIPVIVRYTNSTSQYNLEKANPQNLLDKVSSTTVTGNPSVYMIFGSTSAGLTYIELYPIPETAGTVDIDYKPVLSEITAPTGEDIIMKKYPETVIKLATAWAWQIIKKEPAQYDKWTLLGKVDFKIINLRESSYDPNTAITTETLLANKRVDRYTI